VKEAKHDLVVLGAGPGGYVAAIRAAQLGLDVACIEKEESLGGTCLRVGCIPSKALLEASHKYAEAAKDLGRFGVKVGEVGFDLKKMMAHKEKVVKASTKGIEYLFGKNEVTRYQGHGRLERQGQGKRVVVEGKDEVRIEAKHILIATGSRVSDLPGVEVDGDRIATSTEALSYPEVPEHLILIGAGIIGLELGSVWNRLGSKVTVLEYLDRILPGIDGEIAQAAQKIFKKQGLHFHLGAKVTGARVDNRKSRPCIVEVEGLEPFEGDRVLLAVGRKPNTEGLGLEAIGLETDDKGRIAVDEHFATAVEGVYAIGDVIRGPMLAHKAEEEGVACVEGIVSGYGHVNYDAIPSVVYTHPEIAAVGKTEEDLKAAGIEYKKGSFPFSANGRARAMNATEGLVKVLAHAETDRVLGVHILGAHAGDLIAEAVVAMEFGASSEDIARSSHAHPTLLEALKEAALGVEGRAIHI
jgi:dihydrolipoamide dehydrogenase